MSNLSSTSKLPKLRFPNFDSEWIHKPLSNLCTEITYGLTVRPEYIERGIPLISAREIAKGQIDFDNAPKISQKSYDALSSKAKPKKGDLFLSKTGTIGFSAYVDRDNFAITQNISVIRLDKDQNINPFYLLSYFRTRSFLKGAIRKVNQSTIMDLQLQDIKKLVIALPEDKDEQQKIADFLSNIDNYIQNLKSQKKELEKYKKGMMEKIFSQEFRFKDADGKTYDDWKNTRLGDLDIYVSDGNYGEKYPKASEMISEGIPFIRANNIKNLSITWDDMKYISHDQHKLLKSGHLKANDIIIATRGDIGTLALVDKEFNDANINAQICLLRCGKGVSPKYLLYYLASEKGQSQFRELQTGTALKQLPKGNLAKVKILLPVLEEQIKIESFFVSIGELISSRQTQIEQAELWKKGLMQEMFI